MYWEDRTHSYAVVLPPEKGFGCSRKSRLARCYGQRASSVACRRRPRAANWHAPASGKRQSTGFRHASTRGRRLDVCRCISSRTRPANGNAQRPRAWRASQIVVFQFTALHKTAIQDGGIPTFLIRQKRHHSSTESAKIYIQRSTDVLVQPLRQGENGSEAVESRSGGDLIFPRQLLATPFFSLHGQAALFVSSANKTAAPLLHQLRTCRLSGLSKLYVQLYIRSIWDGKLLCTVGG